MSDLKVDYQALEDSVTVLQRLKGEFDGIEDRRDSTASMWGHDRVRSAMHEFASNMDYNRGKLSEELAAVRDKMSHTLEVFRELEAELVDAMRADGR